MQSKVTNYPHTQNGVLLDGLEEGVSYVGQTVLPRGGWSAVMYAAREGATRRRACARRCRRRPEPHRSRRHLRAHHRDHQRPLGHGVGCSIEKGADLNLADIKGMTPLYAAVDMHTLGDTFGRPYPAPPVIEGSVPIVKMLLARGANPNASAEGPDPQARLRRRRRPAR